MQTWLELSILLVSFDFPWISKLIRICEMMYLSVLQTCTLIAINFRAEKTKFDISAFVAANLPKPTQLLARLLVST